MSTISGEQLTETQYVTDLLTGTDVGTWQADYPLREVEFVHIKNGKPVTYNWANGVALLTAGFGFSLLPTVFSPTKDVTSFEWLTIVCGIVIALILYIIGLNIPNDRKKVMTKIESHFEDAPTKRQAIKEHNQ